MTSQVYIIQQIKKTKTFWGMAVLFNLRGKVKSWLLIPLTDQVLGLMIKEEEYYYDRLSRSDVRPIS